MTRIHFLSPGFETQNGRALLFPLIVWRNALREQGYDCRIFRKRSAALVDCDVLLVDSKFHRDRWETEAEAVIEEIADFGRKCTIIYCDTTDSSGLVHVDLLPVVHGYAKSQIFKDRENYRRPMYGHRLFTDYYHGHDGVVDGRPESSRAIEDPSLLSKLRLSWNSGMADYSLWGPTRMSLYNQIVFKPLLRYPHRSVPVDRYRSQDIMGRFSVDYPRATVAYQRRSISGLLSKRINTSKISRRRYFHDLADTKVIVSPFGYGEINWRDYEVFLTGGLLLKPDMSHMETWPNLFVAGETMLAHSWDLSDFMTALDDAVDNYQDYRALAVAGQERYHRHIAGPQASELFVQQFRSVVGQ